MLNYPKGADLTLLNTTFIRPTKQENGKYTDPIIDILYKDNKTGKKFIKEIKNPTYQFYMANDDVYVDINQFSIPVDKVHKVEVPFKDLEKKIAELTGNEEFYYNNIKAGNRYDNKILHTHPRIYASDMDLQDHYRARFSELYTNNITPITKAFLDIETKEYKIHYNQLTGKKELRKIIAGNFPEPGEAPINAVTYVSESTKEIYTFLLRDLDNPSMVEFEKNLGPDTFNEFFELLKNTVGGRRKMKKYKLDQYKLKFIFYDEDKEIDLIADLFKLINLHEPDFLLVWNMAFDIPYIIERIKKLGYDPKSIMCTSDVEHQICNYLIDERNKNEFAQRGDYADITCHTVYLDQMIQFASRRKGQSAFTSFSLDAIGEIIVGVKKLDYSHLTTDIGELEFIDYKTFAFYNIIDTIVQKCVEDKTQDVNYIFGKCILNDTRYQKGHRQTVYLTNRAGKMFKTMGFVIGNNTNRNNVKEEFGGGQVGDPLLINDYAKMIINSIPIMCYNNLDDFDFKALYPSLAVEHNLAPDTQIGKILIPEQVWKGEYLNNHPDDNSFSLDRPGLFIENLQSHQFLIFCHRWFNLADFVTLITEDLVECVDKSIYISEQSLYDKIKNDGYSHPIQMVNDDKYYHPITMFEVYNKEPVKVDNIKDIINSYNVFNKPKMEAPANDIHQRPTC